MQGKYTQKVLFSTRKTTDWDYDGRDLANTPGEMWVWITILNIRGQTFAFSACLIPVKGTKPKNIFSRDHIIVQFFDLVFDGEIPNSSFGVIWLGISRIKKPDFFWSCRSIEITNDVFPAKLYQMTFLVWKLLFLSMEQIKDRIKSFSIKANQVTWLKIVCHMKI